VNTPLLERALAPLHAHPDLHPGDRVVAAMSGGVDSSVMAALLDRAGYEVIGLSMQLFDKTPGQPSDGKCCTLDDFQDARKVAFDRGFSHYVMDFEDRFQQTVIENFIQGYLRGETPSPCIRCNQYLKFAALMDRAEALGARFVATGHYASVELDVHGWHLRKAADPAKDQSYFLFHHTQATLARTLFPLAHLHKAEVRALGRELGLHLVDKAESQEICFITQGRYDAFLEASGRAPARVGDIRHLNGQCLGHHDGFWRFTVGQRRGLGVAYREPLYVVRIEPSSNTVWVGGEADLSRTALVARDVSWVGPAPTGPLICAAKVRSRSPEAEAMLIPLENGQLKVVFDEPQRALAPGQAVVFYRGDEVLGGGWIHAVL
jgi:tRNA-specific 2-thiouridylase